MAVGTGLGIEFEVEAAVEAELELEVVDLQSVVEKGRASAIFVS